MTFIRKIKLKTRLILTVIITSLIPLIFIAFFSYRTYQNSIKDKLIQSAMQSAQLAANNINLYFTNYSHYIDVLSVSDAVQEISDIDDTANLSMRYDVTFKLNSLIMSTPIPNSGIMGVMILNKNKQSIFGSGYATSMNPELYSLLELCDKCSPKDCADKYINPNNSDHYIALARKIFSSSLNGSHTGYIVVLISAESLYTSTFASPRISPESGFILISNSGRVLASQSASEYELSSEEQNIAVKLMNESALSESRSSSAVANNSLYICYNNSIYDSYLLSVIPYAFISSEQQRVCTRIILLLAPLLVLCILLCSLLNKSINAPIRRMIDACNIDINKSTYACINDESPDELGFLSRTLDEKTRKNIELIENIKENDANKRRLEIEMLHYQINPHFLFNTLGTFKWMAELSNNRVLSEGILSLISLLKSTLVENEEFIPVEKEINNLKHYNRIQDLRYISRFQTKYSLDEATLSCLIPHFILQPLLENAIVHGTADVDRIINILISSKLENGMLILTVSDDGIGFDVNSIFDHKKNRFTGIGLQNVNERMKLYYGPENGLIIESSIGKGTRCVLRIPVDPEQKLDR